jgi:flagellar export protein FliJ
MKRFRFTLQALLTVRQRTEQQALEEYAAVLLELRKTADQVKALQREHADWRRYWHDQVAQPQAAAELVQWQACGRQIATRLQRAEAVHRNAQAQCRSALEKMLLARRDREAVEAHWSRQRELFKRELGRLEQQSLDEMAQRCESLVTSCARPELRYG